MYNQALSVHPYAGGLSFLWHVVKYSEKTVLLLVAVHKVRCPKSIQNSFIVPKDIDLIVLD
jgi:hypothetical protein